MVKIPTPHHELLRRQQVRARHVELCKRQDEQRQIEESPARNVHKGNLSNLPGRAVVLAGRTYIIPPLSKRHLNAKARLVDQALDETLPMSERFLAGSGLAALALLENYPELSADDIVRLLNDQPDNVTKIISAVTRQRGVVP